ncbi:Protein FLX-like 2 [Glycine max]|nr:Protein FLX-like 2 [Glycine max]
MKETRFMPFIGSVKRGCLLRPLSPSTTPNKYLKTALPSFEGCPVKVPGMMRRGSGLGSAASHRSRESLPLPQLLENKIAAQESEIEQLVSDNRGLASGHVALREALVAAAQDVQKLKSHIRSIQTESDIQIRILVDKISKGEVDIRASDSVKKDLQKAHIEAQSLAASRQEVSAQIHRATQELKKVHGDVKSIPDLQAELDTPNLFGAATPGHSSGPFADVYGRVHGQMAAGQVGESMVPVGESNGVAAINSAGVSGALWSSPYDPSVGRR